MNSTGVYKSEVAQKTQEFDSSDPWALYRSLQEQRSDQRDSEDGNPWSDSEASHERRRKRAASSNHPDWPTVSRSFRRPNISPERDLPPCLGGPWSREEFLCQEDMQPDTCDKRDAEGAEQDPESTDPPPSKSPAEIYLDEIGGDLASCAEVSMIQSMATVGSCFWQAPISQIGRSSWTRTRW